MSWDWQVFHHTAARIRDGLIRHVRRANERDRRRTPDCPRCNPPARAMERARDQWVVSGIGRD